MKDMNEGCWIRTLVVEELMNLWMMMNDEWKKKGRKGLDHLYKKPRVGIPMM